MIKEIKYGGFTASPSDYECPDGDLAGVVGLVPEDGSLSPVLPPMDMFTVGDGWIVVFVHKTSVINNYIITKKQSGTTYVKYLKGNDYTTKHDAFTLSNGENLYQVNAIGNVLILLTSEGMYYLKWEEGVYNNLGNKMPEIDIQFNLVSEEPSISPVNTDYNSFSHEDYEMPNSEAGELFSVGFDGKPLSNGGSYLNKTLADVLFGEINKMVNGSSKVGYFLHPFYIRCAYRLYDGSTAMLTPPVLMLCPTVNNPCCFLNNVDESTRRSARWIVAAIHNVLYYNVGSNYYSKVIAWKEIIKSIDVFVSKPIYIQNQDSDHLEVFDVNDEDLGYVVSRYNNGYTRKRQCIDIYRNSSIGNLNNAWGGEPSLVVKIPERKSDYIKSEFEDCHTFYHISTINIENLNDQYDIAGDRIKLNIDEGVLSNLVSRESITSDFNDHDVLFPENSYGYNSRLNLTNVRKKLFEGFAARNIIQYTGYNDKLQQPTGTNTMISLIIYFYIKEDDRDICVVGSISDQTVEKTPIVYIYYPNPNAYKAVVKYGSKYYKVSLIPHSTLNGAYFFGGLNYNIVTSAEVISSAPVVSNNSDCIVKAWNKIYTSEINNPFLFPSSGINTIGTGTILGISTAARALSQGQFGQFPLYAFTTDGVWALEVSSTGSFSAKQPITRDVCINADSITQLDNSVLFATDRGIMLLSGSTSQCISDSLDYNQTFSITDLPHGTDLVTMASCSQSDLTYDTFHEYLKGCRMLYSYNLQRIIVYNPSKSYAYVYSMKSKTWGMMPSTIASTVPSYPEALAMLSNGKLVDYSQTTQPTGTDTALTGIKGMLVTRPLKLDTPNELKTIYSVIQRGNFKKGHIKSALYGSRDMVNWVLIWTSVDHYLRGFSGSPYKYFRIVLLCNMDSDESLYGCSIQYEPRQTNRLR